MGKQSLALAPKPTRALPTLDELLQECQRRRCILFIDHRGRADVWSPCTPLPIWLRRAIALHNVELIELIERCDKRTCPSPYLYKRSQQRRADGVCRLCRMLDASFVVAAPAMAGGRRHNNRRRIAS